MNSMTMGGSPIVGRAIIVALGRDREGAAHDSDAKASQAELDEADLRALECSEYYGGPPAQSDPPRTTPLRQLLARLHGR
jgi:hypothetical protein